MGGLTFIFSFEKWEWETTHCEVGREVFHLFGGEETDALAWGHMVVSGLDLLGPSCPGDYILYVLFFSSQFDSYSFIQ